MLIVKPKYVKKGGSIKALLSNPYIQSTLSGALEGATKNFRKRKQESNLSKKSKISRLINGKGVIYE